MKFPTNANHTSESRFQYPSAGFSKAPTTFKENHNAEITNNHRNSINISERNLNNDVNNTIEKNENPSVIPVKASDPSDPSASLDSNDEQ
ncbi:MAG: hypothetical protein WAM14_22650 [Candidatus Nitrosopolaris sp.]